MKPLLALFILILCLSVACNNNRKKGQAIEPAAGAETAAGAIPDWQQKVQALQQLNPYTIDEMRALIPAQLAGDSASGPEAGNNMGTGYARAVYPINDSASVGLSLFDCGGNAGAGIYQAQFINQLGNQSENENEYTKVIDFKGGKAIEHADKRNNNSSLTFIADRLLVIVEGKNTGIIELTKIAQRLKIN